MKKKILVAVAVAVVLVGTVYGAMLFQKSNDSKQAEQKFIEQMIPHHADAIAMSNMAKGKAKVVTIQNLGADIIRSQQKEIDDMRGWYKSWYGKAVPEMVVEHGGHAGMSEDSLAKLQGSTDFDLEFVRQMIPHHESAIVMARAVLTKAQRKEIKDLANAIIATQQAEIDGMKNLEQQLVMYPPGSIGRSAMNERADSPGSR